MKICVYGLRHLGSVTAACLSEAGFRTIGLDDDLMIVSDLAKGRPQLFEPGLEELTRKEITSGRLSFTADPAEAVAGADLVWVAIDTPVNDEDRGDSDFVMDQVERIFPSLRSGAVVLVSSQLPVGSTAALEGRFASLPLERTVAFAYSPENLRLGRALEAFRRPDRIVVGIRDQWSRDVIANVLSRFSAKILWTSVESAEMAKHALNAFLATCIVFANELATICERVGADASEVEAALRTESRVGPNAYIHAGAAFGGGTLARDMRCLEELARDHKLAMPLISSVLPSNNAHRYWATNRLIGRIGDLNDKTVAILGLAYKPGTDSVRRSIALDLCHWLLERRAKVRAYDPKVSILPPDVAASITLVPNAARALDAADALVVATEWPEFKQLAVGDVVARMRHAVVVDPNGFLGASLGADSRVDYHTIGKPL